MIEIENHGEVFKFYCKNKVNGIVLSKPENCIKICGNTNCHVYRDFHALLKEYSENLYCKICLHKKIDWGFFLIMRNLKKAGLLDEDYPFFCCKCFKRHNIYKFT